MRAYPTGIHVKARVRGVGLATGYFIGHPGHRVRTVLVASLGKNATILFMCSPTTGFEFLMIADVTSYSIAVAGNPFLFIRAIFFRVNDENGIGPYLWALFRQERLWTLKDITRLSSFALFRCCRKWNPSGKQTRLPP